MWVGRGFRIIRRPKLTRKQSKQRKIAVEYVNLCELKQGRPEKRCDNRTLNLDEIASQLGSTKKNDQTKKI